MVEGGPQGESEATTGALGAAGPFRIFINYRRDDSAGYVGRLWDALRSGVEGQPGFSEDQIFMDIDTIEPGVDFREAIRKAVEASDVFLTVIGNRWLTAADSAGRRRLDNPGDFVRLEIEAALDRAARHHDVRVVPTRVQGADMPGVEDLPESLAPLAHRNAIELTDERWHYDVGRLLTSLKRLEREKSERAKRAEPPPSFPVEGPKEGPPEKRWRERIGKRAVVAAIVVALAAVAALVIGVLRNGDEPSNGTPPPSPPERGALVWQRAATGALGGEGDQLMSSIVDIARGGLAYVAGGYDTSAGTRDGAIWTSPDGREWRRAPGEAFERAGDQEITSVAPFARALVAVGTDDSNGDNDIAVWTSSDGVAWEEPVVVRAAGTDEVVNRVTTTRKGLVGAGWQTDDGDDAAVWIVPAGQALEEANPRAVSDPDLGGPGDQRITRVVQLASQLVAVGSADGEAGVWVSDDGEAWDRVNAAALGGDGDQEMLDAARFESTVVAVGRDGERGAVWLSTDGQNWTRVRDPEDVFAGSDSVRLNRVYDAALASRGAALVAGGSAGGDAAVWVSNDGRRWAREPARALGGEGDQTVMSFRKQEGGVIAVGSSESEDGLDAAVWFGAGAE
jgi:hypothetical protein